jgi:UDP-N-acetyl-D-mannosaminuronate dehydrogenase
VSYHDPFVAECEIEGTLYKGVELSDQALAESDLVVILTDHSGVDYGRVIDRANRVFDTRNATAGVPDPAGKVVKL